MRLWDVASGRTRINLTVRAGSVNSVAFSPDGRALASGGADGTVRLWSIALPDPVAAIAKICRAVGRDLTPQERAMYLPGQSPSPVCNS